MNAMYVLPRTWCRFSPAARVRDRGGQRASALNMQHALTDKKKVGLGSASKHLDLRLPNHIYGIFRTQPDVWV